MTPPGRRSLRAALFRTLLDGDGHRRREHVRTLLAELDAQAKRIAEARDLLTSALECDRPHPPTGCPRLLAALDRTAPDRS